MTPEEAYEAALQKQYKQFTIKAGADMVKSLANTLPEGEVQQIIDRAFYTVFQDFKKEFVEKVHPTIQKWVEKLYKGYRSDTTPLSTIPNVPVATFGLADMRAIEFFKKSDSFYLGKFITDEDTKKRITQYIKDEYLAGGQSIGRDKAALDAFKSKFTNVLQGEDWKIRRVIDTTVNKMRNVGAVQYMRQAGVTQYEIIGADDNVTCPYCQAMQGKVFSVDQSAELYDSISFNADSLPDLMPFLTTVMKDEKEVKATDASVLQSLGVAMPPFHPACRDSIVAVFVADEHDVITKDDGLTDTSKINMPQELKDAGYTDDLFKAINRGDINSSKELRAATEHGSTLQAQERLSHGLHDWIFSSNRIREYSTPVELEIRKAMRYGATKFDSGVNEVYRGVRITNKAGSGEKFFSMCQNKVGQSIQFSDRMVLGGTEYDMALLSSSKYRNVAEDFAAIHRTTEERKVVIKIVNEREGGVKGLHLSGNLSSGKEHEIIFGDHFKYKIVSVSETDQQCNAWEIVMEQLAK